MFFLKSQALVNPQRFRKLPEEAGLDEYTKAIRPLHPQHRKALKCLVSTVRLSSEDHSSYSREKSLSEGKAVINYLSKLSSSINNYGASAAFESVVCVAKWLWTAPEIRRAALVELCRAAVHPEHFKSTEARQQLFAMKKHPAAEVRMMVAKTGLYLHLNTKLPEHIRHAGLQVVSDMFCGTADTQLKAVVLRAYARSLMSENADKTHMARRFLELSEQSPERYVEPIAGASLFLKLCLEFHQAGGSERVRAAQSSWKSI